ncbi:MAG: hypothetical protein AABX28_03850 [Nanoarchaeota archaeon]
MERINAYLVRSHKTLLGEIKHEYEGIRQNNGEVPSFNQNGNDPVAKKISEMHEQLISMGLNGLETRVKEEK